MTITLRKMLMSDADFMLELKSLPENRKSDHMKFWRKNFQHFQMIEGIDENGKHKLGAVMVQDNEISIWVVRAYRGRQIAQRILHQRASIGMTAKIEDGNIPAIRAFIGAGFKPVEFVDNKYYIFKR